MESQTASRKSGKKRRRPTKPQTAEGYDVKDEHAGTSNDLEGESAQDKPPVVVSKKKRRLHTYERAKLAFEKIQEDRRIQREQRQAERDAREKAMAEYESNKRRKNRILRQTTRKGQPNLSGQIELLLEKIQKDIGK